VVETQLETTGIDLPNGAGIPELVRFQEHFREYKIVVYHGLNCENNMIEVQVDSAKRLNILYDDVERYYHVIINITVPWLEGTCLKCATKHLLLTSRNLRPDV